MVAFTRTNGCALSMNAAGLPFRCSRENGNRPRSALLMFFDFDEHRLRINGGISRYQCNARRSLAAGVRAASDVLAYDDAGRITHTRRELYDKSPCGNMCCSLADNNEKEHHRVGDPSL